MSKEEILKLLQALGVKIGEGGMSEEDAIKLVENQFAASNKGLLDKRDELLKDNTALKEKVGALEASGTESSKKITDLEAQVKKNNPEEYKAYYEGIAKQESAKHEAELAKVQADLTKYRDSHYKSIEEAAINAGVENLKFLDKHREGFIAIALRRNQFKPTELPDGKIIFTNQDNKTIEAVLHELSLTDEGKAYLVNGNQGGGAQGGTNLPPGVGSAGSAGSAGSIPRAQFIGLADMAKMEFLNKGGVVVD
jgi:hypothetical protein